MKKILSILMVTATILAAGCDKLPLQRAAEYNPKALDPHQHKPCWDYIQTNPDLTIMVDAIEACGLEELYSQTEAKCTYLMPNNAAFTNATYGILTRLGVGSVAEAASSPELKETLTNTLLFHIVKGEFHGYNRSLGYDPVHVLTLWQDVNAVMTMKFFDGFTDDPRVLSSGRQGRLVLMDQCAVSPVIEVTTMTNILLDNGAAHIIPRECLYVGF